MESRPDAFPSFKIWSNSDSNINKYKKQINHVNNLKKHAKEQFYFNVNTLLMYTIRYLILDD
jgi:hypothetical protein